MRYLRGSIFLAPVLWLDSLEPMAKALLGTDAGIAFLMFIANQSKDRAMIARADEIAVKAHSLFLVAATGYRQLYFYLLICGCLAFAAVLVISRL